MILKRSKIAKYITEFLILVMEEPNKQYLKLAKIKEIDETNQTRNEENLKFPMKPILKAHSDLQTATNQLDTRIDDVVNRNEMILNNKYLEHLHQQETKLLNLKEKLIQANFEIENNPEVYQLNAEMQNFTKQSETLQRFSGQLTAQISHYREIYREEENKGGLLRDELKRLAKENLKLSYLLDERPRSKSTSPSKPKLAPIGSKYSQISLSQFPTLNFEHLNQDQQLICYNYIEELDKVKRELYKVKEEGNNLGHLQGAFLNEQRKLEIFFQNCTASAKTELFKNQQMPQVSSKGLAGSLFFELVHSEQANLRSAPMGFLKDRNQRSHLQERDCKNVIYYTVKRMMKTARDDTRKQQLSKLNLS